MCLRISAAAWLRRIFLKIRCVSRLLRDFLRAKIFSNPKTKNFLWSRGLPWLFEFAIFEKRIVAVGGARFKFFSSGLRPLLYADRVRARASVCCRVCACVCAVCVGVWCDVLG